jgi:hypothetical protein
MSMQRRQPREAARRGTLSRKIDFASGFWPAAEPNFRAGSGVMGLVRFKVPAPGSQQQAASPFKRHHHLTA